MFLIKRKTLLIKCVFIFWKINLKAIERRCVPANWLSQQHKDTKLLVIDWFLGKMMN